MRIKLLFILIIFFFHVFKVFGQDVAISYDNDFQLINNSKFAGEDSLVSFHYPDGSIESSGKIALDKSGTLSSLKVGEWTYYFPNGSIKSKGSYQISSFIDCGTGGLERVFYHYKIGKWSFFDKNEDLIASGNFKTEELPISTRCDTERILFGLSDSDWVFQDAKINRKEIESITIKYETFSATMFYNRENEKIEVEYNFPQ